MKVNDLTMSEMAFGLMNNVSIEVIDTKTSRRTKTVEIHNKATRGMVFGILRFLMGHFSKTEVNPEHEPDNSSIYIPCYFNVGDGGVVLTEGLPTTKADNPRIPELDPDWNETVDYLSTDLTREFTGNERAVIRKQTTTLQNTPTADMDSIYFHCQIFPGTINAQYSNNDVYVTELGLFSTNTANSGNLLAQVKLGNYKESEDSDWKTNALYVRPQDTIIIRWVITIAAIGKDNILKANIEDEHGEIITSTIHQEPSLGNVEVITNP